MHPGEKESNYYQTLALANTEQWLGLNNILPLDKVDRMYSLKHCVSWLPANYFWLLSHFIHFGTLYIRNLNEFSKMGIV